MAKAFLDFPIWHIEDNLVFSKDGRVTAYYAVPGFNYEFLSDEEKFMPFMNQLQFFQSQGHDVHEVGNPQSSNILSIMEETREMMREKAENYPYPLHENGDKFIQYQAKALVEEDKLLEKREYRNYVGIQLLKEKNRYQKGNRGTQLINGLRQFLKGLNAPINQAIGLNLPDILRFEIEAYHEQAKQIGEKLKRAFSATQNGQSFGASVREISLPEMLYMIESRYSATPNFKDIHLRKDFETGVSKQVKLHGEEIEAITPNESGYRSLQQTFIEEVDAQTLRLTRNVDGKAESLYVRCFVLTKFTHDEHEFPGNEWLYHLQKGLSFPFLYSGRLHYKPNENVMKQLSNKKLDYEDQKEQAAKANTQVDLSTADKEKGVILLEKYFEKTAYPTYDCSLIFRIQAQSLEELQNRSETFQEETRKMGLEVFAPFGEQPHLFMEMIPGGKQQNQDYQIEVDPRMIAGMMFGAASGIGDDRGIYLGETLQGKPVFIYPELASKAFDSVTSMVNSISAMIAGSTGFGKSVLQNLLVYLSVLTGSLGLVIDPKNDRKKWKDGLPYIPKDAINYLELNHSEAYRGVLDPFRTSVDVETGQSVATDIFAYLTGAKMGEKKYNFLMHAFSYAAKQEEPCVSHALAFLDDVCDKALQAREKKEDLGRYEGLTLTQERLEDLIDLQDTLQSFMKQPFTKLLMGQVGDHNNSLNMDYPLQVVAIEQLNLPKNEKDPEDYTAAEKISTALLTSLTAYAQQFMMHGDRTRHKIIISDEADITDKNDKGRELNNTIVRRGRYFTTSLIKGAQNASDQENDINNMGMKFCFHLNKTEEATQMLHFMGLPITQMNIRRLTSLERGVCLFQDIYGRVDILRVNPVFDEVLAAFDTSTSSVEERKREKERSAHYI
ncbi:ATP-binding protein [Listeria goaensis]|uniref:ATP-binding protein n=1 Tax=Listeria goaensis TaxID=1649188 RepID=UPI000B597707|nr:ATP-binding protein [Listeria goaensis]